jgi:hypothetical protein
MTIYRLTENGGVMRSDGAFIPDDPANADWAEYQAWLAHGNAPDPYVPPPAPRRLVPKSIIVARLNAAGKLAAAKAALDADLYARERWYAADRPAIYVDDREAVALLTAIGADVAEIMA